jgi:ABC-type transport system substrate-binding protein
VVTKIGSPYALIDPAIGSLRIMPKHILESVYDKGDYAAAYNTSISPDSLVTSGPWKLKQFVQGEKTVLTRNPYWFGSTRRATACPISTRWCS